MRITVVTHAYPRHPGDVAGAFIARLSAALAARGHAVRVLLPTDAGRAGQAAHDGVTLEWVRYDAPTREMLAYRGTMAAALRSPRGMLTFWRLLRAMTAALRRQAGHTDVVHAHWWVPGGLIARRAGLPYVVTMHGTDVAMLGRVPLAPRLARGVFERARAVTAVSGYLAAQARAHTGFGGPIQVQPMPITAAEPAASAPSAPPTGLIVVGRLTAQKRVHLALDALPLLPDDVTLTIVGDGPEREALERRAHPLGTRVRFIGTVPPEAVRGHLASARVMVFPAEREGLGLAVAEAVMAGVPVVATEDGGGVADLVVPEAGRLVAPEPAQLAAAIRALLEDSTAGSRAAIAGEALGARLAPEAVAQAFERLYHEAAG